ncbi:MAG: Gfo/Idh/MocA family oxidoreductase [Eubacteriales bacterium]|nr:Gfo/Idh/MocA family oxidoreductase [Eubacteriales bacterium]
MRAAIVGCGNIAAVHAASLEGRQEIVGFADIIPERAQRFADRCGGRAFASLEELMEAEKPEVLHICTPHYLHVPMAEYGLAHGAHVFAEKPPAMNEKQWESLERAAGCSEKRLGFCFQNRYNPSVLAVKRLLASGACGRLLGARGIVTWNRQAPYYTESGWRGSLEKEGGGALINQSIHTLDLLTEFLGRPVRVEADAANHHLKGVIEVEDMLEAFIGYEGGQNAVFYATTAYCDDRPPLIELSCEKATVRIEDLEVTCFWRDGRVEKPALESKKALGKSYWGSGHQDCIADFYRCCETGERFLQDLDGVRNTMTLMFGAYRSAREGREIAL